jgi:hypothetical protein
MASRPARAGEGDTKRSVGERRRSPRGALALASVTAVLKSLLENGLAGRGVTGELGGDATVSALPPDRVTSGADERAQLNLFLYHVTPHVGLRAANGGGGGALALELHYLLTAYGAQDYQTEILLGHALQLLHETPVIGREELGATIASLTSAGDGRVVPPALAALVQSDLAEQVEQIRILPEFLGTEDMAKLWSSLQAKFRPSLTYKVSAVLIRGEEPA